MEASTSWHLDEPGENWYQKCLLFGRNRHKWSLRQGTAPPGGCRFRQGYQTGKGDAHEFAAAKEHSECAGREGDVKDLAGSTLARGRWRFPRHAPSVDTAIHESGAHCRRKQKVIEPHALLQSTGGARNPERPERPIRCSLRRASVSLETQSSKRRRL